MKAKDILKLIEDINEQELLKGMSDEDREGIEDNIGHIKEIAEETQQYLEGARWYHVDPVRSN